MCSVQHLREFIRERLTAAAEEIFTQVEKTIISYEEELDAQRRMMGISWKPDIKLHRVGSELQRQSSGLQDPHVSVKEEAAAVQQEQRSRHGAESQWTDTLVKVICSEEEQMEPEPPLTEEHWEPGSLWIKEEEEETQSAVFDFEEQEPEPLPTRQNQKHVCSGQEGERLDQKQFAALMETFTLQSRDLSEGEARSERPSFQVSAEAESKEQEGSSSTVSETQTHSDGRKGPVSCGMCGRLLKNK
ncbi:uncharacterized protein LOC129351658 [Poeciliopsis prolifica]|nr:uncharacterized protein LOC129351658 [Poeciliopsis prolifica]